MRWILAQVVLLVAVYTGFFFLDDFNPESVRGKRVLVTGASAGIGEQLAYHYARLGASIVVTARTESKLQQVIRKCKELGSTTAHFSYISADMSDMKQTPRVIQNAVEQLGGLDILVLNHMADNKLELWGSHPESLERLHEMMSVNFFSYVHLASHALRHLQQSAGSIVVVSSLSGKHSTPTLLNYCSSKFALEGFFDGLRQELVIQNTDVSVTLCFLGFIGTESAKKLMGGASNPMFPTEDPADTALSILKAGISRVPEMYYPHTRIRTFLYLKQLAPRSLEKLLAMLY